MNRILFAVLSVLTLFMLACAPSNVLKDETSLEADKLTWSGSDKDTVAEGNVKIKKSKDMYALADKCIISPGYDKFKIIGKTKTEIYGKDGSK